MEGAINDQPPDPPPKRLKSPFDKHHLSYGLLTCSQEEGTAPHRVMETETRSESLSRVRGLELHCTQRHTARWHTCCSNWATQPVVFLCLCLCLSLSLSLSLSHMLFWFLSFEKREDCYAAFPFNFLWIICGESVSGWWPVVLSCAASAWLVIAFLFNFFIELLWLVSVVKSPMH